MMTNEAKLVGPSEHSGRREQQRSLHKSALSSSAWAFSGFGLGQAIRLGSNIILAAILFEEAFALMAIVAAIIQGLAMFSDIGLGPSIVQNRRGDERDFLDTAWTIQVIRGVALTAIAMVLAWPLAAFYAANDALAWELRWLIPLVVLGTLIEGFQSTKLKTAARHMNLARITVLELICQVTGIAVMVGFAWWTRSVYALALGTLGSASLHCLLSHVLLPGRGNRFRWDRTAVREIVSFGKWVLVSTIISFFALQIDKLVFARLFPLDEVGIYAIAASLAMLTPMIMGRVQGAVAFPLYSRILDRGELLESIVRRTKIPMLTVGGYLVALSIAGAGTFVGLAYDDRYTAAGIYIPILVGGAWFAVIDGVYGAALLATGRAHWVAAVNATKVTTFCLLLVPAMHFGGLLGAVVAVAASDAIKLLVGIAGVRTIGLRDQKPDVLFTLYSAGVGVGVMLLTQRAIAMVGLHAVTLLVVQFVSVTLAFSPFLFFVTRSVLKRSQ